MRHWDMAAVAAGASWATSVLLVSVEAGSRADTHRVEAVRHLCLAVAATATVCRFFDRTRKRSVAQIREVVESHQVAGEMRLINVGRVIEAAERDAENVVQLRTQQA